MLIVHRDPNALLHALTHYRPTAVAKWVGPTES